MSSIHSEDHQKIVTKLKQAREDAGYDQSSVAKLLNKTQSYISKMETGQRKIDIVDLKKLASIYKKSITYFIK